MATRKELIEQLLKAAEDLYGVSTTRVGDQGKVNLVYNLSNRINASGGADILPDTINNMGSATSSQLDEDLALLMRGAGVVPFTTAEQPYTDEQANELAKNMKDMGNEKEMSFEEAFRILGSAGQVPIVNTYVFADLPIYIQKALDKYKDFPDGQWFEEENIYISGVGQFLSSIHPISACKGREGGCTIHNPSNHHMRHFPVLIREDLKAERVCKHGVGHPDPDWLTYMQTITTPENAAAHAVHGCDGCCGTDHPSGLISIGDKS